MTVTEETNRNGQLILSCDQCSASPSYGLNQELMSGFLPLEADWFQSCRHIEGHIMNFEDAGTIKAGMHYHFNLSPVSSWLARDQWHSWLELETSEPTKSGLMDVTFNYESEFYTDTSGKIGQVTADDGRQSFRNMLWDDVTTRLFARQPNCETEGIRCPISTHGSDEEPRFRESMGTQDGVNAQVASIVFENCCTYCYRKTMGHDANFGMDEVKAPPRQQSQPRLNRNGNQAAPRGASSSTTSPQGRRQPSNASGSGNSGNASSPPVSTAPERKPGQTMAEFLGDSKLPF